MTPLRSFARASMATVFGLVVSISAAQATSVYPATTEDLAHLADLIVVGEVQAVAMKQEAQAAGITGQTVIRTHNSIRVVEVWKGDASPGDTVDVVDLGGWISGHSLELPGTCGYQVGERVLLFLQPKKHHRQEWLTLGLFLGKLTVLPDGKGGQLLATVRWKMEERGQRFVLSGVPAEKFLTGQALVPYAGQVKAVVDADRAQGIDGKWLPKYDGMGVGR